MAAIPKMMKKRFSLFIVLVYHAWLLCGVHASTPPGTLLTFNCTATWEYTDETDTIQTATSKATCNLVVVRPEPMQPVYLTRYDPLAAGRPVVVTGILLLGGGLFTSDGRVLMPVGGNQ